METIEGRESTSPRTIRRLRSELSHGLHNETPSHAPALSGPSKRAPWWAGLRSIKRGVWRIPLEEYYIVDVAVPWLCLCRSSLRSSLAWQFWLLPLHSRVHPEHADLPKPYVISTNLLRSVLETLISLNLLRSPSIASLNPNLLRSPQISSDLLRCPQMSSLNPNLLRSPQISSLNSILLLPESLESSEW